MSGIDERVVSMKFNNGQFLTGVAATIEALAKLKHGLNLDASKKGLDELSKSASSFPQATFSNMAHGVEGISAKFIALSTIGITALTNITNAAIAAGTQLVKSLTIEPIKLGLQEYETNLNSIQTILANTSTKGTNLEQVSAALEELNHYSDQTIYNFSEMARNIGTFTAAGVDLDVSTRAIKGIANLAAVSGSNAQQASTAMYQLSQSLASGKVTLEDWNSVVNAGMGGAVFQEALKETARVHGVAVDQIIQDEGSFRNSLQKGWITSEILTETLSKFTGDLNAEQLKTMGYTDDQIAGIIKMGQTATDAATKVKTMSQLISTLQETAQSGWAKTWQTIFGDFEEAKTLFTGVNNVLGGMIGASADARNEMFKQWKDLGGRTILIESISNAFDALMGILKPLKEAFREIFPAVTGERLFAITEAIRDFTAKLKLGASETDELKRTFKGFFALLDIGLSVIKGLFTVVGSVFKALGAGSGDVLEITARIGDFLVKLNETIKQSESFKDFFKDLGNILAVPIELLSALPALISKIFDFDAGGGGDALDSALERIAVRLEPFEAMGNAISKAWGRLGDVLQNVWDIMGPFATEVARFFGNIGEAISNAVAEGDFSTLLDTVNTGLFAALVLGVRKFLSDGSIFNFGSDGEGLVESIKNIFGGLTDTLSAMQANLNAGTLVKIAGAIALLTAAVVALSLIDSVSLTKALSAMTVMFLQLAGAMALLDKISSTGIIFKLAPMAAGLILLAAAIVVLSGAVKILSTMDWEELGKGLTGVVVLLGAVAGAVKLMQGAGKGFISAGLGIVVMALGLKILVGVVKDLGAMDWEDLGKGLAGVATALGVIAATMRFMPASLPITALGLIGVSAALVILSKALKAMGAMSWEEIGKSMVVLAGSLAILAGAMYLMTGALPGAAAMLVIAPALVILSIALKKMSELSWEEIGKMGTVLAGSLAIIAGAMYLMVAGIPGAAAMLIIAPALVILSIALKKMSELSWEEIGKMGTVLAGSLLIIAGAMYLMVGALPGAAALVVVAAALTILAPVLLAFGGMSWDEIGRGLTVLAGALAIIGVAGLLLTPVIPTLIGLGIAIGLIGVGTLAAGVGVLALSAGLTALSIAGIAGAAAIVTIVSAIIGLIPMAMRALAEGIVLFAEVIANSAPTMVAAMTTLLASLLTAIDTLAPKIIDTLYGLVLKLVNTISENVPKFVDAGLRMITGILNGIANNISGIVQAALNIVASFIDGISRGIPRLIQSGINLVITFIESLADGIRRNSDRMNAAGRDLASAIIEGMVGGIAGGVTSVVNAAKKMAASALAAAKAVLGIKSPSKAFEKEVGENSAKGMAIGLTKSSGLVEKAAENMGDKALNTLIQTMRNIGAAVSSDMDLSPTIRPVLDLSSIKKDSKTIGGILAPDVLALKTSNAKASSIVTDKRLAQQTTEEGVRDTTTSGTTLNYTQNITSPKAVSNAEIYRQTKNQLSIAKKQLPVSKGVSA